MKKAAATKGARPSSGGSSKARSLRLGALATAAPAKEVNLRALLEFVDGSDEEHLKAKLAEVDAEFAAVQDKCKTLRDLNAYYRDDNVSAVGDIDEYVRYLQRKKDEKADALDRLQVENETKLDRYLDDKRGSYRDKDHALNELNVRHAELEVRRRDLEQQIVALHPVQLRCDEFQTVTHKQEQYVQAIRKKHAETMELQRAALEEETRQLGREWDERIAQYDKEAAAILLRDTKEALAAHSTTLASLQSKVKAAKADLRHKTTRRDSLLHAVLEREREVALLCPQT